MRYITRDVRSLVHPFTAWLRQLAADGEEAARARLVAIISERLHFMRPDPRVLLALCILGGCAHVPEPATGAATSPAHLAEATIRLDATPRLGIATAFAPELAALLPSLAERREHVVNGRPFYTGTMAGKPVVLFETGVSIVNAAMSTQVLFDRFTITGIVVSGIAGGVDPALSIGDVTVPDQWGQYNEMIYMRDLGDGRFATYEGYSEEYAPFEFMRPNGVRIVSAAEPSPARRFWFGADPGLMAIAREAAAEVQLQRCAPSGQCLEEAPELVIGGNGVTGSVFLDNAAFREYLFATFDAKVVEMETAPIAMVAHANGVPFIAFRSLSDLAGGGDAEANEMDTFMDIAAINAAAVVMAFLERYTFPGPPPPH